MHLNAGDVFRWLKGLKAGLKSHLVQSKCKYVLKYLSIFKYIILHGIILKTNWPILLYFEWVFDTLVVESASSAAGVRH